MALIAVLLLMLVSLAIGLLSANSSRTERAIAHNQVLELRALAAAEAGIHMLKQQIESHYAVVNSELALNTGCACATSTCNYGVGASGSGLEATGGLANVTLPGDAITPRCYRFAAFGGGASDGYYLRVEDNLDEPTGTDAPLADVDQAIRVISHGVIGTAERTVIATFNLTPGAPGGGAGIKARDDITFGGNHTGGRCRALNDGTPGSTFPGVDSVTGTWPNFVYGTDALVRTTSATSDINMQSDNVVWGDQISGGTNSGNPPPSPGTATANAPPDASDPFPSPIAACAPFSGASGINVGSRGSYDPSSGLLKTGGDGNVTIAPGTYCFGMVKIESGATLTVTGPTVINVTDKWIASSQSIINNTTHDPANLIVNSSVVGKDALSFTGDADSFMQINAPLGEIVVGGGGNFFGSIVGTEVSFTGGSCFHQYGTGGGGTPGVVNVTSWHEVQH